MNAFLSIKSFDDAIVHPWYDCHYKYKIFKREFTYIYT